MKLSVFSILFFSCYFQASSQYFIKDLSGIKVGPLIEFEKSLNSQDITSKQIHFLGNKRDKVNAFKRQSKQDSILTVSFYYNALDSIVSLISYEWINEFEVDGVLDTTGMTIKNLDLISRYKDLYRHLFVQIGESSNNESIENYDDVFSCKFMDREDIWVLKNVKIKMYIYISSNYEKGYPITVLPSSKIGLYVFCD